MITLTLTPSQAARIAYAMEAEASEHGNRLDWLKANGSFSVQTGRAMHSAEHARDEALDIVRQIDAVMVG